MSKKHPKTKVEYQYLLVDEYNSEYNIFDSFQDVREHIKSTEDDIESPEDFDGSNYKLYRIDKELEMAFDLETVFTIHVGLKED